MKVKLAFVYIYLQWINEKYKGINSSNSFALLFTWYQSPKAWIEKNFSEYTVGVKGVFETPNLRALNRHRRQEKKRQPSKSPATKSSGRNPSAIVVKGARRTKAQRPLKALRHKAHLRHELFYLRHTYITYII